MGVWTWFTRFSWLAEVAMLDSWWVAICFGLAACLTWAALLHSFDLKKDLWRTGSLNWVWGWLCELWDAGYGGGGNYWMGRIGARGLCGNGRSHRVAWVCGWLLVLFCWWDWGRSMGSASFVVKRGVWGTFVVLVDWGRFNSIRGMMDLLWPEVGLWPNGSSFVIVETMVRTCKRDNGGHL